MDKELQVSPWAEWKITEKIGEGSFGKVYKAQRTERGRSFYSAIKIITIPSSKSELNSVRSETADESSTREYFQNLVEECVQEISTMEYFRGNSHIVSVEDFKVMEYLDEIGWDISIRMEYLTSFIDYCTGKVLTEKEVLKLGCDLSKALEYCGQLHIIHRDIKPENIFVSRFGDFKLGDFGIARELERSMGNMSKKGTYSYMAPEVYRGEPYDSRADIYSLGIVMYRLLNHNRLPFLDLEKQLITYRDKENALNRRMSGETLPPPAEAGEELAGIIRRACAFRPEDRYQSPEELFCDLDDLRCGRERRAAAMLPNAIQAEPTIHVYHPKRPERDADAGADTIKGLRRVKTGRWRSRTSGQRERDRKAGPSPWTVAAMLLTATACVITAIYAKYIMDENARIRYSQTVVTVLEDNENSTAQIDDFSTTIQTIRDQVTAIVNMLPDCKEEGKEGERFLYYDEEGKLVKALIYPEMSDDGVYEEYYYWEERLFFAYIWTEGKQDLYYYDTRGKMIRWIDEDGNVHDNETDSTEYTKRGEKYWKISLEQFD